MTLGELETILRGLWSDPPVRRVSEASFVVPMLPQEPPFLWFPTVLSAHFCTDRATLHSVCLAHRYGLVDDPAVCAAFLQLNAGGVRGSPYYFSIQPDNDGRLALWVETQTPIVDLNVEAVEATIAELCADPILLRQWAMPRGIRARDELFRDPYIRNYRGFLVDD